MTTEKGRADDLQVGDLIIWKGENWYVTSLFIEGSEGTMSLDLMLDDDSEIGGCHASTNHLIQRVRRAAR